MKFVIFCNKTKQVNTSICVFPQETIYFEGKKNQVMILNQMTCSDNRQSLAISKGVIARYCMSENNYTCIHDIHCIFKCKPLDSFFSNDSTIMIFNKMMAKKNSIRLFVIHGDFKKKARQIKSSHSHISIPPDTQTS